LRRHDGNDGGEQESKDNAPSVPGADRVHIFILSDRGRRRNGTGEKWGASHKPDVSTEIRTLIRNRRKTGIPDLDDDALNAANIDELRQVALLNAKPIAVARRSTRLYRVRSLAIRLYVLRRANGHCELAARRRLLSESTVPLGSQHREDARASTSIRMARNISKLAFLPLAPHGTCA
jgi:hypothetical protein